MKQDWMFFHVKTTLIEINLKFLFFMCNQNWLNMPYTLTKSSNKLKYHQNTPSMK